MPSVPSRKPFAPKVETNPEKIRKIRAELELILPDLLLQCSRLPRYDPDEDPAVNQGDCPLMQEFSRDYWFPFKTLAQRADAKDILAKVYRSEVWKNRERLRDRTESRREYHRKLARKRALERTDGQRAKRAATAKASYQADWWGACRKWNLVKRIFKKDPSAESCPDSGSIATLMRKHLPTEYEFQRMRAELAVYVAVWRWDPTTDEQSDKRIERAGFFAAFSSDRIASAKRTARQLYESGATGRKPESFVDDALASMDADAVREAAHKLRLVHSAALVDEHDDDVDADDHSDLDDETAVGLE